MMMPWGGESGIVWEADFMALSPGAGGTLPSSLQFSRALGAGGISETVQINENQLLTTGLVANVPRIGQYGSDAETRGLVFEHVAGSFGGNPRSMVAQAFDRVYFNGGGGAGDFVVTANYTPAAGAAVADLTGSALADRIQSNNTLTYHACQQTGVSQNMLSFWGRAVSGTSTWSGGVQPNTNPAVIHTLDESWRKYEIEQPSLSASSFFLVERNRLSGSPNTTRDIMMDYVCCQSNSAYGFLTESVQSPLIPYSRPTERLWLSSSNTVLQSGRVNFYARIRPKGASSVNWGNNMQIWWIDANNRVTIDRTTMRIQVVVGGTSFSPATPLAWGKRDILELWIEAGGAVLPTKIKYRVNGGATVDLSGGAPTHNNVTAAAVFNILCSSSSSGIDHFTSWVQKLAAYKTGYAPAWAA
jgi:hypothetical protein